MATTYTSQGELTGWPYAVSVVEASACVPGEKSNVSHGGPDGAKCAYLAYEITEQPTSRDPVYVCHDKENDSVTNDTARVVIDTVAGGDLAGCVVRLMFHFIEQASGGNRAAH